MPHMMWFRWTNKVSGGSSACRQWKGVIVWIRSAFFLQDPADGCATDLDARSHDVARDRACAKVTLGAELSHLVDEPSHTCSVHKVIGEAERFYRSDFRGIDLLGVQKLYPRLGRVFLPSLFESISPER